MSLSRQNRDFAAEPGINPRWPPRKTGLGCARGVVEGCGREAAPVAGSSGQGMQDGKKAMRSSTARSGPDESYRQLARAQLARVAGLDRCDPAVLEGWVAAAGLVELPRGAVVWRRGQPAAGLLLVVDGVVAIGRHLMQKGGHLFTYLGPGDLFGFVSLLDGGPLLHDVMAHQPSVLLLVPPAVVAASQVEHPAVREAFAVQMAHRSRIIYDRLFDVVSQPLSYRLARHLDFLGKAFGADRPQGVQVTIRISQTDLAQALGASRQQVNAELKKFEERGLVAVSRAAIVLRDPEALESSSYSNLPVTLRRRGRGVPVARPRRRTPTEPALTGELKGLRVLLVEDDAIYRLVVAAQLHHAGAQVDEAEDGEAAVAKVLKQPRYDAIVMDEHMPLLSGSEATRRIRDHELRQGQKPTPILGVSSDAGRDHTKRFLAAGMDAHLAKPFLRVELIEALKRLLG